MSQMKRLIALIKFPISFLDAAVLVCALVLPMVLSAPVSYAATVTSSNLITNPGAETSDFTGWTVVNGGDGWAISGLFHSGSRSFITSYFDGTLSQEINLSNAGYNGAAMDAQPYIDAGVWVMGYDSGSGTNDPYSVRVELRDASHAALVTWDTGSQTATGSWAEVSHRFTNYGTGVRYVYMRLTGRSSAFWAGQFGAAFDDASVTLTTSEPTSFTFGSYSDNNGDGKVDRLTVAVNFSPLTTCDVSSGELASDWTYNGSTFGGGIASASCNLSTGTITFTLTGGSDHYTGGPAPTIAYNNTDGDNSIANSIGAMGTVTAFSLADSAAPVLQEGTPVTNPTNDNTPNYSFFSSEQGTITYAGGCTSATTTAFGSAGNVITFSTLADGTYGICTIKVTDSSGNQSALLAVTPFTVDTTTPSITGFTASIVRNTLTATWTTNEVASTQLQYGTGALSNSTSVTDTSPRTTAHTVIVSGVDPCNPYTVRATSVDATGNTSQSSSFNIAALACGGVLPAIAIVPPVLPATGFQVSAARTSGNIMVTSNAGDDVKTMAISSTSDFANVGQIPYSKVVEWGSGVPGYSETAQTLYVKFYTSWGQVSSVYATPVVSAKVLGVTTASTSTPRTSQVIFKTTLTFRSRGPEVKALQELLATMPDIYPEGSITGFYGSATRSAVQRFQLQYGLTNKNGSGYGVVGPVTRVKLNSMVQ